MRFPKTNPSQGMSNSKETPNNLAKYLKLPSGSTKANSLFLSTDFKKTATTKENMSNGQTDKIQGLANIVQQIQVTLNQHIETLQDKRNEERLKEANVRRGDNLTLAFKSFAVLVGFFICMMAIGALTIWIRRRCQRSKRATKQRDQDLAELKKRMKDMEEGGEE